MEDEQVLTLKARELILSYKQEGQYDDDTEINLEEMLGMANNREESLVAIMALYLYAIKGERP